MGAAHIDLTIEASAYFTFDGVVRDGSPTGPPVPLTGYGARMMVRADVNDATPAASLTVGSGITLGTDPGSFTVTMDGTLTAAIGAAMHRGVYDLWLDPTGVKSGSSYPIMAGEVILVKPVTR
jgi:hypothetical protein